MLKDPVCGKRINRHRAQTAIEYDGWVYYLCCPLCQAEFERRPAAYAQQALGERAAPAKGKRRR